MSRAIHLDMSEADAVKHCRSKDVDISVIETLPDGGIRLVCSSSHGAQALRTQLRRHLITDPVRRERIRPRSPLW
jgi:hypothetical protein